MQKLAMALTAHGLPHVMGYLPTKAGESNPAPLGVEGLMDAAVELGLSAIEVSLPATEEFDPGPWREALRERGLRLVPDFAVIVSADVERVRAFLRHACALGAPVVRVMLSTMLCGDRRAVPGGWPAYLETAARRLNEILPYAEELGVCVAMENHQDCSSDDLLRMAELTNHSPAFGVTLDTGNALAVGEGPVEFATRIAHLIRHVHLKDYTIHFAPEGYRLVRCAAGDGVVDFPEILRSIRATSHDVLPGIEIAAQATRTIPMLDAEWWACYPSAPTVRLIPALQILWAKGRPMDESYSSAWERGEDSATVSAEEWDVLRRSVDYFRLVEGAGDFNARRAVPLKVSDASIAAAPAPMPHERLAAPGLAGSQSPNTA